MYVRCINIKFAASNLVWIQVFFSGLDLGWIWSFNLWVRWFGPSQGKVQVWAPIRNLGLGTLSTRTKPDAFPSVSTTPYPQITTTFDKISLHLRLVRWLCFHQPLNCFCMQVSLSLSGPSHFQDPHLPPSLDRNFFLVWSPRQEKVAPLSHTHTPTHTLPKFQTWATTM